jgi:hypothetical protein
VTRDQLDALVWRLVTGMYAGDLKPPQVHGAIMHAADLHAAGAAHRAALETALSDRKVRAA